MDLKSIRARCSDSVTDMVSSPSEYYRAQQIMRDRADLLAEVDRLLERLEKAEPLIRQASPMRSILTEEGVVDWQARRFEWLSDSAEEPHGR